MVVVEDGHRVLVRAAMRFSVIDIAAKKLAARFVNEAVVNRGSPVETLDRARGRLDLNRVGRNSDHLAVADKQGATAQVPTSPNWRRPKKFVPPPAEMPSLIAKPAAIKVRSPSSAVSQWPWLTSGGHGACRASASETRRCWTTSGQRKEETSAARVDEGDNVGGRRYSGPEDRVAVAHATDTPHWVS
jgi:hypothetical protein